jgi:hypothetical protein
LNSGRTGASYPEIVYIVTHGCSLDYFPGWKCAVESHITFDENIRLPDNTTNWIIWLVSGIWFQFVVSLPFLTFNSSCLLSLGFQIRQRINSGTRWSFFRVLPAAFVLLLFCISSLKKTWVSMDGWDRGLLIWFSFFLLYGLRFLFFIYSDDCFYLL